MSPIWTEPQVPRSVVCAIPVDLDGRCLVHLRSMSCRSARGVWSFPTGTHEIGEDIASTIRRELEEEHSLAVLPQGTRLLGLYENIGDTGYHWVIAVYAALVASVRAARNNEPDRHEQLKTLDYRTLGQPSLYNALRFHPSFEAWARQYGRGAVDKIADLLKERT